MANNAPVRPPYCWSVWAVDGDWFDRIISTFTQAEAIEWAHWLNSQRGPHTARAYEVRGVGL